jgi:hypothetical protein
MQKVIPPTKAHERLSDSVYARRDDSGGLWVMSVEDGEVDDAVYLDKDAAERLSALLAYRIDTST